MSSVMSRPYAFPVGPTRFAESSTSIPPPDPRSSTVSPAFSCASAVGFPHPREAATTSFGNSATSPAAYKSDVIGSQHSVALVPHPQPLDAPAATRRAASPYFVLTTSLMFSFAIASSSAHRMDKIHLILTIFDVMAEKYRQHPVFPGY